MKHAVRNAIMPVITVMDPLVAAVLKRCVVVAENIFAIPGLGKMLWYNVYRQITTSYRRYYDFLWFILNFGKPVVDLIYGFIDLRVKINWWKGVVQMRLKKKKALEVAQMLKSI